MVRERWKEGGGGGGESLARVECDKGEYQPRLPSTPGSPGWEQGLLREK